MRTITHLFILFIAVFTASTIVHADTKPQPLSPPIASPTPITVDKGIMGPEIEPVASPIEWPTIAMPNPDTGYVDYTGYVYDQDTVWDENITGFVLCDKYISRLIELTDKYFASTFCSVMQRESGNRPDAFRLTTINDFTYEVVGCMQLLLDSSMRSLIYKMSYTVQDMYDCSKNVLVAQEWYKRTGGWRLWEAKPKWSVVVP